MEQDPRTPYYVEVIKGRHAPENLQERLNALPHLAEVVAITQDPTESNHYTLVWRES